MRQRRLPFTTVEKLKMPRIHFIDRNGVERIIHSEADVSVMQAAVTNDIPGIASDCGGCCLCASCHAWIDRAWIGRLERPSQNEANMLDHIPNARYNSRLTCKIWISDDLDGLVVRTP